jgi:hypothetical protein
VVRHVTGIDQEAGIGLARRQTRGGQAEFVCSDFTAQPPPAESFSFDQLRRRAASHEPGRGAGPESRLSACCGQLTVISAD